MEGLWKTVLSLLLFGAQFYAPHARAEEDTKQTTEVQMQAFEEAGRGIPIIFGGGEDLSFVRELPPKGKKYAAGKYPKSAKVGIKYNVFHIFFVNIWTWNGQYILYDDNGFAEPSAAEWTKLLGKGGTKKLSKPFFYRFPPGAIVLGVLILGFLGLMFLVKTDEPTLAQSPEVSPEAGGFTKDAVELTNDKHGNAA